MFPDLSAHVCVLLRDVFSLCPLSDGADSCAVSFISSGWGDRKHGLARRDIRITTSQTLSVNQTPTCCLLWVQLSHFHPRNHSENSCALPPGSKTGWLHTGISREGDGKWVLFFPEMRRIENSWVDTRHPDLILHTYGYLKMVRVMCVCVCALK